MEVEYNDFMNLLFQFFIAVHQISFEFQSLIASFLMICVLCMILIYFDYKIVMFFVFIPEQRHGNGHDYKS